jgi:hypothetical protein
LVGWDGVRFGLLTPVRPSFLRRDVVFGFIWFLKLVTQAGIAPATGLAIAVPGPEGSVLFWLANLP